MDLIIGVEEGHSRTMFRVFGVQDFYLKHHLKAGHDLASQPFKSALIDMLISATVALFGFRKHYLGLFIELVHLLLLYNLDRLPRADDPTGGIALPVLVVVDWVSLSHDTVDHIHGARVLRYV